MEQSKSQQKLREPYKKPVVRVIELAAKEVLAVGCKNGENAAETGTFPPCWSVGCQGDGS